MVKARFATVQFIHSNYDLVEFFFVHLIHSLIASFTHDNLLEIKIVAIPYRALLLLLQE